MKRAGLKGGLEGEGGGVSRLGLPLRSFLYRPENKELQGVIVEGLKGNCHAL